jgi:hypothetical protein
MRGGGEMLVPASAPSPLGGDDALIGMLEVMHQRPGFVVIQHGAYRDFQNRIHAFPATAVGAFAMASALGFVFRIEAKVNQRIVPFARFHDDIATASAITAGGAAAGNKLLSPEGNTPVAAIPRLYSNSSFIDKHIFSVVSLPATKPVGHPEFVGTWRSRTQSSAELVRRSRTAPPRGSCPQDPPDPRH